ncbi:MAG: DNA polymerase III subunit gamma/tau [Bacteroidota bacterium]|nr:DNA polymerase III subunit gamma/tau [Bacteroidota bacterium]
MDKFIVSARKYRPQNFNTVVGQSHITTTLKNAIRNNQLAHAFLFCGPRGVGKTTCARILAKTINCENRTPEGEACNTCNSCVSFDNGSSLNIHELDAASNNSVDDIRTLVEQVRFAPQAGAYKVYIIDEVHMLTSQAFNAFLKTLEEPPPFAIFILATTEKHKILPTILSRCQIFDFKRITNQDTVDHLMEICDKEHIRADKGALHIIAQKSEGCLRDALSILDKIVSFTNGELSYANTLEHLNILDEDYYFRLLDAMQEQNMGDALLQYDEINRKGFEGDMVLNGLAEFFRNLLVSKDPKVAELLEVSEGFAQRYRQAAKGTDPGFLISALNILNEAEINYRQARNKRLHVEMVLIKLCFLNQALQLVSKPGSGVAMEKQVDKAKPVSFRGLSPVAYRQKDPAESKPSGSKPAATKEMHASDPVTTDQAGGPSLRIHPEVARPAPAEKAKTGKAPGSAGVRKTGKLSLKDIHQEVAQEQMNSGHQPRDLNEEELYIAWGKYIEMLRENNNHSGVTNFRSATLKILDQNNIEIVTHHNLQQRFIEAERASLIEHLQAHFNNRLLVYKVSLDESAAPGTEEGSGPLTVKEQFLKIIEEYPLVKSLKDHLGLQLDY